MRDSHPDLAPGLALAYLRRALVACDRPGINLAVLHNVARPEAMIAECRIVVRTLEKVPDWERRHGRHRAGRLAAYVNRAPLQQDRLLHTPPVCWDRGPLRNSSWAALRIQGRPCGSNVAPHSHRTARFLAPWPSSSPPAFSSDDLDLPPRRSGQPVRLIRSKRGWMLSCVHGGDWLPPLLSSLLSVARVHWIAACCLGGRRRLGGDPLVRSSVGTPSYPRPIHE